MLEVTKISAQAVSANNEKPIENSEIECSYTKTVLTMHSILSTLKNISGSIQCINQIAEEYPEKTSVCENLLAQYKEIVLQFDALVSHDSFLFEDLLDEPIQADLSRITLINI